MKRFLGSIGRKLKEVNSSLSTESRRYYSCDRTKACRKHAKQRVKDPDNPGACTVCKQPFRRSKR